MLSNPFRLQTLVFIQVQSSLLYILIIVSVPVLISALRIYRIPYNINSITSPYPLSHNFLLIFSPHVLEHLTFALYVTVRLQDLFFPLLLI